jgi:DNA-binding NarL/FixJ family response regulator
LVGQSDNIDGRDGDQRGAGMGAPAFALTEPAGSRIGERLATIGWSPVVRTADVASLDAAAVGRAEVLVIACSERQLLSPAFQAEVGRCAARLPRVAVVAAAGPEAAAYAARLGWQGFIPADAATRAIARTIIQASRGELSFPMSATSALVRALARMAPVGGFPAATLTPRQRQIVTLIAEGATDADIATILQISRSTAHKHVQNARRRLRAKTRGQLVAASREIASADGDVAALLTVRRAS